MTIERPMFPPVDQARRHFLTATAAAAASAIAAPAWPAASTIDPIFDLIQAHRKAHVAHLAAIEVLNRFERRYGAGHGYWITERPCIHEHDVFTEMVSTPAITLPGLIAKLDYLQELSSEFDTEWMIIHRAEAKDIIQSFAASIKNILVEGRVPVLALANKPPPRDGAAAQ